MFLNKSSDTPPELILNRLVVSDTSVVTELLMNLDLMRMLSDWEIGILDEFFYLQTVPSYVWI